MKALRAVAYWLAASRFSLLYGWAFFTVGWILAEHSAWSFWRSLLVALAIYTIADICTKLLMPLAKRSKFWRDGRTDAS